MPSTITTTAEYTATAPTFPVDGEDLAAADVEATLQTALNRAHYARGGLWGQLLWSGRFAVAPGGTSTVFAVTVGAISSLCVRDATGTWRPYYVAAETTLTLAHVEGAPAALSNSTWYYVYAYSDGTTTLKFLINTTAPDATGLWQSAGGDALRRYIGCFRTTSGGAPIPVRAVNGRYTYRISSITSAYSITSITSAQAFTDLSLASVVPPHARIAHLLIEAVNGDADAGDELTARVRTNGDTTSYDGITVPPAAVASTDNYARATLYTEIETDSSQVVEVEVSGSSTTLAVSVYARGFQE